MIWQQIDPKNSERVFHAIDTAVQRAILDDEVKYAVHAIRGDEIELRPHMSHADGPPPAMKKGPASVGRGHGSPKPHNTGSPRRLASPKTNHLNTKIGVGNDASGTRTVSRGKPRPGSAAAAGSTLKSNKGGSA